MTDFATLQKKMVDNQLRTSNVTDRRVLEAMGRVPRHVFVNEAGRALAYADCPQSLGAGRALAAPAPLAKLLQLAELKATDRALDVGAGTGYVTAVLAAICESATGLEPDPGLAAAARANFAALGLSNAAIAAGPLDGSELSDTYDVIILDGTVDRVPQSLLDRLADGGRLLAVIQESSAPVATVFVRAGTEIGERREFNAVLPPLAATPAVEAFRF